MVSLLSIFTCGILAVTTLPFIVLLWHLTEQLILDSIFPSTDVWLQSVSAGSGTTKTGLDDKTFMVVNIR